MDLGEFSVSLAVKDLKASMAFYQRLGFEPMGGSEEDGWLMIKSGSTILGLFQGMFDENILTFAIRDVRGVQKTLLERGVEPTVRAEDGEGPAHVMLSDPDGNRIMLDQF